MHLNFSFIKIYIYNLFYIQTIQDSMLVLLLIKQWQI